MNDTAALSAPLKALRPYQRQCLERLRQRYRDGKRRLLVSLPTGTGKTVIFAQFPQARTPRLNGHTRGCWLDALSCDCVSSSVDSPYKGPI